MFLKAIFDLIFPEICFCCGDRVEYQSSGDFEDERKQKLWEINRYLCPACLEHLVILSDDICPKCGNPILPSGCPHCTKTKFLFDAARSVFLFDDRTRRLIHGLKYYRFRKIAPILAAYASLYLENHWQGIKPDILIPVPLHKVKFRERGFNQSAEIGRWLAKYSTLEYREDIITRNRYTRTQTSLGRHERHKNVENAFNITNDQALKNKTILLLDDVFTTGATCNSIAQILIKHKVRQVFVLTIARPSQIFT